MFDRSTSPSIYIGRFRSLSDLVGASPALQRTDVDAHHPGYNHLALYRVETNDGPHLIKVTESSVLEPLGDAKFARQVEAQRMAADFGGPKIFDAGQVQMEDGRVAYFIDMELLFPDATETFTLKGMLFGRADFARIRTDHVLTLSRRLIRLLESKVFINDVDAIFSKDGDVRWIDATGWRRDDAFSYDHVMFGYGLLIEMIAARNKSLEDLLVHSFRAAIEDSGAFDSATKIELLDLLEGHLAGAKRLTEAKARVCGNELIE